MGRLKKPEKPSAYDLMEIMREEFKKKDAAPSIRPSQRMLGEIMVDDRFTDK